MFMNEKVIYNRNSKLDKRTPAYVYHELADGRLVPIEIGGLVELALSELGGQLVDVVDERAAPSLIGLN
jgi:hypothetical protein